MARSLWNIWWFFAPRFGGTCPCPCPCILTTLYTYNILFNIHYLATQREWLVAAKAFAGGCIFDISIGGRYSCSSPHNTILLLLPSPSKSLHLPVCAFVRMDGPARTGWGNRSIVKSGNFAPFVYCVVKWADLLSYVCCGTSADEKSIVMKNTELEWPSYRWLICCVWPVISYTDKLLSVL